MASTIVLTTAKAASVTKITRLRPRPLFLALIRCTRRLPDGRWGSGMVGGRRCFFFGVSVARRAGSADLPLHTGRVPAWLGRRMAQLGAVIAEAVIHHYGREEFLRRLAHRFRFQSFGAVMGMDWHSSRNHDQRHRCVQTRAQPRCPAKSACMSAVGVATLSPSDPHELALIGDRVGFDGDRPGRASRLVRRSTAPPYRTALTSTCTASSSPMTTMEGGQQGMNGEAATARRYHWLSEDA